MACGGRDEAEGGHWCSSTVVGRGPDLWSVGSAPKRRRQPSGNVSAQGGFDDHDPAAARPRVRGRGAGRRGPGPLRRGARPHPGRVPVRCATAGHRATGDHSLVGARTSGGGGSRRPHRSAGRARRRRDRAPPGGGPRLGPAGALRGAHARRRGRRARDGRRRSRRRDPAPRRPDTGPAPGRVTRVRARRGLERGRGRHQRDRYRPGRRAPDAGLFRRALRGLAR